ncbi:response regulator [Butyricicoccus faecihominis]|uniref:response regulator n=1 Tax=Butyricicoccus faecihominis TaxID=1712515 RepID=UPI002479B95F|nr:helix-turn-helix domain-containing protein [Butyricicoccus faecihominis]MCQ5131321.1 response regulator [Butyricicoccus faecihominis]
MLHVFVVDDEEIIRTGIRNALEKTAGQFHFAGEAPDGEMALPALLEIKPDILITDVRMPFMDGLELAELVRKSMPWMRIIFLSGHDEFEYAQRAVSLRVDAYILKPVDSQRLLSILEQTASRIEEERRALRAAAQHTERQQQEREILREHFLSELLTGGVSPAHAIDRAREWNLPLTARQYVVLQAVCGTDGKVRRQIRAVLGHMFDEADDVVWFFEGNERLVLLVLGEESEAVRDRAYAVAQGVRHELEQVAAIDCKIGIGGVTDRLSGLPGSYRQARQAAFEMKHMLAGIAGYGDLNETPERGFDFAANVPLAEKLRHAGREDIPALVDAYFGAVRENDMQSVLYRYYLLMDLLVTAARLDSENAGWEQNPQTVLRAAETCESTVGYAKEALERLIGSRAASGKVRYAEEIQRAKEYITAHYGDEGLSLHTVAAAVGFSPNHFSTVFSQQTGETFVEYLTRVRIDAAKDMLRASGAKMSDIAFDVGYHDPNYFSYIFKKHTGASPREYRAGCQ